ncbi:hypothetical protein M595_5997 [Lyngbya aestuarii BL J]|uniref:Uncharacterized protein n=1 Tax=Lyngbya aestuarii BL J TaxID=1348334 RepID=U7Q899_9CYAN|nr:hypothetical protein M595_5997 [Lyngbya aestuarii BL J]
MPPPHLQNWRSRFVEARKSRLGQTKCNPTHPYKNRKDHVGFRYLNPTYKIGDRDC